MIRRNTEIALRASLADTRVVLLNGARQTGKSTLALQIVEQMNATYVNLDDAATLALATSDPRGLIQGMDNRIVIDEVQRAPELFPEIKMEADANPQPGRFLLTGSANVLLLPQLSEFLTGRIEIITLWPLSQGEIEGRRERFVDFLFSQKAKPRKNDARVSRLDISKRILSGGYPEAIKRKDAARRREWYGAYISTLLQRDVRDLAHIDRLADMPRLLSVLAARTGNLMNMSELSRTTGIAFSTLRRYLGLLEATFVLQIIPAWSTNLSKRLVKSPKIFLIDGGLTAYLIGQTDPRTLQESTQFGHLLEAFVVMELRKQIGWSETHCSIYHYRSSSGREVDILLEDQQGRLVGLEIKASARVGKKDFTGLESLAEIAGDKFIRGVVLYTGDVVLPFGSRFSAMPISALWTGGLDEG
ncbi:MAG: ATP-binding protein [Thermoleophilia bacterium]